MRLGRNPAKDAERLPSYGRHRIIVPVYIPHHEGYFANAVEILALCLTSLRKTTEGRASITVVANGCCGDVRDLLSKRFRHGWFDQLVLNETNRGKVDALVSAARGSFEPFITFSDCDVLFRHGWLDAVERVFVDFPRAGVVCPFPCPPVTWHHTSATVLGGGGRGQLRFSKVVDDLALERLSAGVGDPGYVEPDLRRAQLTVQKGHAVACVGAVHIVCTVRREIVAAVPVQPSLRSLGKRSEASWLDAPADRLGFWRLSTPRAYATHMGNQAEPWMVTELSETLTEAGRATDVPIVALPPASPDWPRFVPIPMRQHMMRLMQHPSTKRWLFRRFGHPGSVVAEPGKAIVS